MKKSLCLLLVLCMAVSLFAGCTSAPAPATQAPAEATPAPAAPAAATPEPAAEPAKVVTIRAAVMPQQLSLPLYYISKQGWDVENGFKLELSTYQSGAPMNEALGAGLWDVATIGAAGVLSCSVYNAVHIMSHMDSSAGLAFMIRADSKIAAVKGQNPDYPDVYGSAETIKGTTFLMPIGSGHQLLLEKYLSIFGLTTADIQMVNMDHATSYQAFVSGQGDYSATAYPTTDKYLAEGYVNAFDMISCQTPYYDNIVVSRKFFDDPANKPVMVALVKQLLRVADTFQDQETMLNAMLDWYTVNGQKVEKEGIRNQTLQRPCLTVADYTSSDTNASFKSIAEFYASVESITPDALKQVFANIDTSILDEAIKEYSA